MDVNEELRNRHGREAVARRRGSWARARALLLVLGLASIGLLLGGCGTGAKTGALPSVRVQVGGPEGGDSMSVGVQLLLLLTVLSLVHAILMMVTSFIRIAIVLSFARTAIGMPQLPPNQIVLGLALCIAPMAAGIALTGAIDWRLAALTAAVTFWTAGFDIIYACQDYDFDRQTGLHSIPVRFGLANALLISRILHFAMIACLFWLRRAYSLDGLALTALARLAHRGAASSDHAGYGAGILTQIPRAFFNAEAGRLGIHLAPDEPLCWNTLALTTSWLARAPATAIAPDPATWATGSFGPWQATWSK